MATMRMRRCRYARWGARSRDDEAAAPFESARRGRARSGEEEATALNASWGEMGCEAWAAAQEGAGGVSGFGRGKEDGAGSMWAKAQYASGPNEFGRPRRGFDLIIFISVKSRKGIFNR